MYKKDLVRVIKAEKSGIEALLEDTNWEEIDDVIRLIKNRKGKVVFLGVGKSGHVGEKLSATFSSTGTPSLYIHATESCHGDLGMIEAKDIVILCSNSGSTKEVIQNIEPLNKIGATLVCFTAKRESPLCKACKYKIVYPDMPEADKNGLAPSTSTTMQMVLGDAIGLALSDSYKFTRKDFHKFHPNGTLGATLEKEENK